MRLAVVQCDVSFGQPDLQRQRLLQHLESLSSQGVEFALFPEAFLTGYGAANAVEAQATALERSYVAALAAEALQFGAGFCFGFIEREGTAIFNTACLGIPGEPLRFYRKTHLPFMGADRFADPGDELPVFETKFGRIGILICFDMRYPEAARSLTLRGADLILIPTNWPKGAEISAELICIARAAENHVWVATCNRVGHEKGFDFIGRSKVIDPLGAIVCGAGEAAETLIASLDIERSSKKRRVVTPGVYEIEILACRNPKLYVGQ